MNLLNQLNNVDAYLAKLDEQINEMFTGMPEYKAEPVKVKPKQVSATATQTKTILAQTRPIERFTPTTGDIVL